jgi:phosphoglycolate phosphatase-like HAD superfamily hydrolase
MTKFSFDIVGFDLDGTLLDTSGDLTAAVNHALVNAGRRPLTVEEVKPMGRWGRGKYGISILAILERIRWSGVG